VSALTQDEARDRAAAVAVDRYRILVDVTAGATHFDTTTTVTFEATQPETFVELLCDELRRATLDGEALPPTAYADGRLRLSGLGGMHELVVDARFRYSHDGEGLHRFVDPADDAVYLCATSSVDNAKRWFACFDQPDLKGRYDVEIRCPSEWTVVGNGVAEQVTPGHWRLAPTEPISTYLVTVLAGPWHTRRSEHDGIPLGLHVRRALREELDRDAEDLFRLTAASLDAFHELFGIRYPFGQYDQAFVPEFNWGAMEQPGCVTFRDQLIFRAPPTDAELLDRTTTVVHEMAHMWFGNLVTMRWWDDLWLNESFAEYLALRVTAAITDLPAWEDFGADRKAWGYAADRRATTHPVAGNGAPDARAALADFDGISYAKGASVLRQLAAYLGDDVFREGLRDYIRERQYGNAVFADLVAAWAARTGPGTPSATDLDRWTTQWLRRAGVDIVQAERGGDGVALHRLDPLFGPPAERPHALTVAALPSGVSSQAVVDGPETAVSIAVDDADVVLANAGDESWATVRLDAADWPKLPQALSRLGPGPARVVLWNALRTALADDIAAPDLVVESVIAGLPGESAVVAEQVLRWITSAVPLYVAPGERRVALLDRLAAAADERLNAAAAGTGGQRSAARAWLALTTDVDALRRWSDGQTGVAGLTVDAELRWGVLERRAALGALDQDEIAAAFAADRSAAGAVHARRCEALRPDPAGKERAWQALVDPSVELSNYQLAALAGGFWVPGQEDLVAAYAPRWFAEMPATAEHRSNYSLRELARLSFPGLIVDADIRDRAAELAARLDLPAALRRVASDGAVELERALAVRARFA
jgi:aminopeptidase N